jgi:glycosyltransferase involved in cell wall biosynthesis
MKKENSGLARSTIEIAEYEEKAGHTVCIRQPSDGMPIAGRSNGSVDIECIHSQILHTHYHNEVPKVMWMHGEPLSSVGNGISMKAIIDLAPLCEAFICMRREEAPIWSAIKRTYQVPKGIDLQRYKPLQPKPERLSGEPAVLYVENWRGERNPLYLCIAMQKVHRKYPNARLHLYNCQSQKMHDTFMALHNHCKWWPFLRTLSGPEKDVNTLYNRADMVVSCLYPLYARGIEAFGAGIPFIGPGYKEPDYPWTCDLDPNSMADAIIDCWENYDKLNPRKWAEERHDATETVRQAVEIYERYA